MNDIPSGFTCKCRLCGAEFYSFYYDGGVIEHENQTSDWNIKASIVSGDFEEYFNNCDDKAKKHILLWIEKENLDLTKLLPAKDK